MYTKTLLDHAKEGDQIGVKYRLEFNSDSINMQDEAGNTAIHLAIANGHFELAYWLMNWRFEDDSPNLNLKNKQGKTAIDLLRDKVKKMKVKDPMFNNLHLLVQCLYTQKGILAV